MTWGQASMARPQSPRMVKVAAGRARMVICTCLAVDRQQQAATGVGAWLVVEN